MRVQGQGRGLGTAGSKLIVQEVEPFDGEAFAEPPGVITVRTDGGALANGRHASLLKRDPAALSRARHRRAARVGAEQGKLLECRMPLARGQRRQRAARRAHGALRRRRDRRGVRRGGGGGSGHRWRSPACTLSLYCDRVTAHAPRRGPPSVAAHHATERESKARCVPSRRGFRDVLPAEAAEREAVSRDIAEVFSAWGYGLVETPVVEDLVALEAAAGPLEGTAFRLVDLDGRLLALRPDMTVPIARLVASRLAGQPGPHRFRYAAEVFREHESLRGQARQFTQAGVELVGAAGPAADAEVIAVLVEALDARGLARVHRRRRDRRGAPPRSWRRRRPRLGRGRPRRRARSQPRRARRARAAQPGDAPRPARALARGPANPRRPRGDRCLPRGDRRLGCEAALDELEATGAARVPRASSTASPSTSRSCARSTTTPGSSLEAYAPGLGCPARRRRPLRRRAGGVRRARAGGGFALGIERLMIALVEQGAAAARRAALDAVVGGEPGRLHSPLHARFAAAGWRVALSARTGASSSREATRLGRQRRCRDRGRASCGSTATGSRARRCEDPLPYPPTTSWAEGGEPMIATRLGGPTGRCASPFPRARCSRARVRLLGDGRVRHRRAWPTRDASSSSERPRSSTSSASRPTSRSTSPTAPRTAASRARTCSSKPGSTSSSSSTWASAAAGSWSRSPRTRRAEVSERVRGTSAWCASRPSTPTSRRRTSTRGHPGRDREAATATSSSRRSSASRTSIVDITATGTRCARTSLRIVEDVLASTARFVGNPAAVRTDPRVLELADTMAALSVESTPRDSREGVGRSPTDGKDLMQP